MLLRNGAKQIGISAIALGLAFVVALPIVWAIAVSFKDAGADTTNLPGLIVPPYTMENYQYVLTNRQANIGLWTLNSLIVASVTTTGVLAFASLAAYSFARFRFVGRSFWFWLILTGLMIPNEVRLIPMYILFRNFRLLNSYYSLVLPLLAAPFGVVILYQFMRGIPEELYDAAKIDGASSNRIYWVIVLPLTKAALSSLAIFVFLGAWNDFLWPFIAITNPRRMTIPVGIPFFNSQYATDMNRPMAANALAALPVLFFFFVFQKSIVKGISLTGIKG